MQHQRIADPHRRVAFLNRNGNGGLFLKHRGDRDILGHNIKAGCIGLAVAPLPELIPFGRHCRDRSGRAVVNLPFQACLAALVVAGQGSLGGIFNRIAHRVLGRGRARRRAGRRGGSRRLGGAQRDIVGVGAAVLRVVGVGGHIVQQGPRAGSVEGIPLKIAGVGKSAVRFEDFGAVEELVPGFIAQQSQLLVGFVNDSLQRRRVGRRLGHRRNGVDNHIAIAVGGSEALEHIAVVGDEVGRLGGGGDIVAPQRDDDAARLHLGQRLRDGVGAGIILEIDAGSLQHIADRKVFSPEVLVQADLAVFIQRGCVLVADKNG